MVGTTALGPWKKGGNDLMKRGLKAGVLVLAAMVFGTVAWAFDAYFADSAGSKILQVQEGNYVYIVIKDEYKGACGIDEFQADLVIFDFKTGAYINAENQWFRQVDGTQPGLYFWVQAKGSSTKVAVPVGDRDGWGGTVGVLTGGDNNIPNYTHILGDIASAPTGVTWNDGAWMYVDEDVLGSPWSLYSVSALPNSRETARVNLEESTPNSAFFFGTTPNTTTSTDTDVYGRLENMDTLVLIVADDEEEWNIDQDQVKIIDTVSSLTVTPEEASYACAGVCENIVVEIDDPDENLNCNEVDYVPFFVIVNPGSWNPQTSSVVHDFCTLMMYGGVQTYDTVDKEFEDLNEPIRWYNIYGAVVTASQTPSGTLASRWIAYPREWLSGKYYLGSPTEGWVGRVLFFAAETGVNTGQFKFTWGNLQDLQEALGFSRFAPGTTIAFYYIDPNDFDDMTLATIRVAAPPEKQRSEVHFTNYMGTPIDNTQVDIGDALYVRVVDPKANDDACCQDDVLVHLCDPHNEDDSEYWRLDEVANDAGIFGPHAGMPLEPVWDAIGGYQLVFDDWKFQAFNEDTIFARYNSVDYYPADVNALGDGDANDGRFPPRVTVPIIVEDEDISVSPSGTKYTADGFLNHTPVQPHSVVITYSYSVTISGQSFSGTGEATDDGQGAIVGKVDLVKGSTDYGDIEVSGIIAYSSGQYSIEFTASPSTGYSVTSFSITDVKADYIAGHAGRYNPWDVAFALIKVSDTQVFDGTQHNMYFLNGKYEVVDAISISDNLYLEVHDPDQNENSSYRELIAGDWNKDADATDASDRGGDVDKLAASAGEDSAPVWWEHSTDSDIMTPEGASTFKPYLGKPDNDRSISGLAETVKIFIWNAHNGAWERMDLKETAPNSGIFRSTICVPVSGTEGLNASVGHTIMAFYQDPSNHSDVSIISIKVVGGEVTPPPGPTVSVEFDKDEYVGGETVTITVIDDQFAGQSQISGTDVLILKLNDNVIETWDTIPAVPGGDDNDFAVEYILAEDASGTLTVTYTQPFVGGKTVSDTATVGPAALQSVSDVSITPNPFDPSSEAATFALVTEPDGAKAETVTLMVFDLLGRKLFENTWNDVNSFTWDGGDYRSGAYIAVVVVEDSHLDAPFVWRGFVYIKR